jgi:AcrR family transcriptional regulator
MKTLSKRQRGRAGRANLIRAALGVFSRKGFESTSVEEVCLAAGYSKGGFYFHFRSKDDLLAAILERDGEIADGGWLDALSAELWAQAARDEAVRGRLAQRDDSRQQKLLKYALASGKDPKSASRLLGLLLLLDAGLRVQQRFLTAPGDEAQRFVDSLLAALTLPTTETEECSSRAAAGESR